MAVMGPPSALIFLCSIAIPLIIGALTIRKYKEDVLMINLGVVSIIIGFFVGFANVVLISEHWFIYAGMTTRVLFTTAMIELLFIPLMILGGRKVREDMISNRDWRRGAQLVSISLAAVLVITFVGGSMITVERIKSQFGLDIRISVNATYPYFVYLPVPLRGAWNSTIESDIIHELQFATGQGEFSVISTEYGPALNVSSTGTVTLRAEGERDDESFSQVSLRNRSYRGPGEQFLVFSNSSFGGGMLIEVEFFDDGVWCLTQFHLSAASVGEGWESHDGTLESACF